MVKSSTTNLEKSILLKAELTRFLLSYKFALDELNTKISILKEEFQNIYDYNPVEYVTYRLKTPESILEKIRRRGFDFSLESIKENIRDIAGIRITCSFISDIYRISEMLQKRSDLKTIECKDYIKKPKSSGYKSLHLIVKVPILIQDKVEEVFGEIQIRTVGMDFWANLEHKVQYKFESEVPPHLVTELKEAADSIGILDAKMENIHNSIMGIQATSSELQFLSELLIDNQKFYLPLEYLDELEVDLK